MYTDNAAQVISNCLKSLCKNAHIISETETFSEKLSTLPPLKQGEEGVSDDAQSLFTNIQTTDYTTDRIYVKFFFQTLLSEGG